MKSLSQKELKKIALDCEQKILDSRKGQEYFEEPFRHIVIDNFFPEKLIKTCESKFPYADSSTWIHSNDNDIEVKARSNWESEFDIPEGIVDAVKVLNSSIILRAMSQRIGIPKLIPDPYFSGGGLNMTQKSGLLDVHVDGNYHDATGLNRRINLLIYLNSNWQKSWKGELGFYDKTGKNFVKSIDPEFNRCLIFDTHDFSYHGLPEPIRFPAEENRKSIILYYYTKEPRPKEHTNVDGPHSALWRKRGLLDKKGNKKRDYS
mgnify:FL=1